MLEYCYSEVVDKKFHEIKKYVEEHFNSKCFSFMKHKFGNSYIFTFSNANVEEIKGHGDPSVWMFIETTSHKSKNNDYHKYGFEILIKGKFNELNRGRIRPWDEYNDNYNFEFHHFLKFNLDSNKLPYIRIGIYNNELDNFTVTEDIFFLEVIEKLYNSYSLTQEKIETIEDNNDINLEEYLYEPDVTEKEIQQKTRIKQGLFKERLLRYNLPNKCKLCGLNNIALLIASHIKPWSISSNKERLDPFNGLLLCPIHDALFDKKLITFQDNGDIQISKTLSQLELLNINIGMKIDLPYSSLKYLEEHRKSFLEIE